MTLEGLHIKLKGLEVPEDRYYLHGLYGSTNDNDKLSLTVKKKEYSTEYEVYYKERGEKHSVRLFKTENDACQYVYSQLKEHKAIENKYSK